MKKQFGQFFTTNSDYILQGFEEFLKNKEIIDPFAGNQDLIKWVHKNGCKKVVGFDCDKNYVDGKNVLNNDSINSPQKYKFVCTNPPYLHKNKADQKTKERFFSGSHSNFEDLYQVSIFSILNCEEGILIVPLNFLCAENSQKIRNLFFDKFKIVKLNIFSEQVFKDTTYNVISFYFRRKKDNSEKIKIPAVIFPENKRITFIIIEKKYNWQFGGDFINRIKNTQNHLGIFRLTEDYLKSGEYEVELAFQNIKDKKPLRISKDIKKLIEKNILFLRAIDSKNGKKIQLEDIRKYGVTGLVGKNTSRNAAHLIFKKEIPINDQIELMKRFNEELNRERSKYLSFFLTNFRDNNRKRISFELTYKFLNYIYDKKNSKQSVLF
ncbi:MAG: N-6 DNA methylase [Patescibacteria group bacterium]